MGNRVLAMLLLLMVCRTRRHADAVFNNFLDLIGRPERRRALPSRGVPAWMD